MIKINNKDFLCTLVEQFYHIKPIKVYENQNITYLKSNPNKTIYSKKRISSNFVYYKRNLS